MKHKFNDVEIRTPTSFSVELEDYESGDSCTTLDGIVHTDVITQKRVLSYQWADPDTDEIKKILELVSDPFVKVYYPDPINGWETRVFKRSGRKIPFRDYRIGERQVKSLSFTLKEKGGPYD